MTQNTRLFTSESVSDGHPDKVCDQISDALLDEILHQDPDARCAIDCSAKGDTLYILGEVTTTAHVDYDAVARKRLHHIGYGDPRWKFPAEDIKIVVNVSEQSPEIGGGVTRDGERIGAGDQGIMFGYAVQETPMMMPLPIQIANDLTSQHRMFREVMGPQSILGPDAKAQVTIRYDRDTNQPLDIDTVVFSSVHDPDASDQEVQDAMHAIIGGVLRRPEYSGLSISNTRFLLNPAGRWTVGGPVADSGMTGRKIIVDTYGGAARHGGGAFSGKDPTKVDRSAAYAARHLAKLICDRKNQYRAEVQLSYAIGYHEPTSVHVYGWNEDQIWEFLAEQEIDLSPQGIIDYFDLKRPIYARTAAFGHFGRTDVPWEIIESDR